MSLFELPQKDPEVLDKGAVIVGGITYNNLIQSVELAKRCKNNNEPMIDAIDYKDTNISTKVVKIIQSYKDIINLEILGGNDDEIAILGATNIKHMSLLSLFKPH